MHEELIDTDNIIIGSGPSGISAAWALIKIGQKVTILDVGEELEPENNSLRSRLASCEPNQWHESDIISYTKDKNRDNTDEARPFGSDFLFRDSIKFFKNSSSDNLTGLKPSFAKGGLSNGWGSSILPYRKEDIKDWPADTIDLAKHYDALSEFMPIASKIDDLHSLFPMQEIKKDTSVPLTAQAQRLLDNLNKNKKRLNQSGIYFGQARQAMSSKDCRQCAMCLYGCPYGVVYSTRNTLDQLILHSSVTYKKGYFVTKIKEHEDCVQIWAQDINNNNEQEFSASKVFVACGVIPSAKLMMNSLEYFNKPIYMKDSQHFFLPMIHTWRSKKNLDTEKMTSLVQLFVELTDPDAVDKTAHIQIYTFNDFYAKDIKKRLGFFSKPLKPLINLLSRHLIVAQGFLHSDYSSKIEVRLNKEHSIKNLKIQARTNPKMICTLKAIKKRLSRLALGVGLLPLLPLSRNGTAGSSFHCGATFPMKKNPIGLESDTLGRIAGLKRVYIIDASVLPSIPATTITLSVMANAHRIAMESCEKKSSL
jgi:choline dehydrogenase-like flavoprotein